jgi:hypothetical protein
MIAFKITCLFRPEWRQVYKALFNDKVHCRSVETPDYSVYAFEDVSIVPKDLGPAVIVEQIAIEDIPNP